MDTVSDDVIDDARARAERYLVTLGPLIERLETTAAEDWQTEVCRSDDSQRNCLLGHIFAVGEEAGDLRYANALVDRFDEMWSSSFCYFRVNDGKDADYPQPTARERVLALLRDLDAGRVLKTMDSMDADLVWHLLHDGYPEPIEFTGWMLDVPTDVVDGDVVLEELPRAGRGYHPHFRALSWPAGLPVPAAQEKVDLVARLAS